MPFVLAAGELLKVGESLESANGLFALVMQGDGNLVARAPGGFAYWSTDKFVPGGSLPKAYVKMQTDGNVVVYDGAGGALWASDTSRGGTNSAPSALLKLQNDGNLVLRIDGKVAWTSDKYFSLEAKSMRDVYYAEEPSSEHIATLGTYGFNVENSTDTVSPTLLGVDIEFSNSRTFETTMGVSVGVETEVTCGIPMLAEGKVTVGVEVSMSVAWGKQVSESQSAHVESTVDLPPKSKGKAIVTITQDEFEVPYTATADYTLTSESGVKRDVRGPCQGVFKGGNGYTLNSHLIEVGPL